LNINKKSLIPKPDFVLESCIISKSGQGGSVVRFLRTQESYRHHSLRRPSHEKMNARRDTTLAHWAYVAPLLTPPEDETGYLALQACATVPTNG
jgi:hypothetical protein